MSHATGYTRHAVNGVPRPTRSQLRARRVWLRRDEQVAVEWRQVQRARNEAPSVVVVLLAVRKSPREESVGLARSTALRAARTLLAKQGSRVNVGTQILE